MSQRAGQQIDIIFIGLALRSKNEIYNFIIVSDAMFWVDSKSDRCRKI